ncbi:hypothetical protein EAO28_30185 [Klebsiella pneumoniae]|uniref:Uncharacterized protein n=1 Tax=Klebsiella pneumoniae TaxID=573 RepID=A0A3P2EEY8_KLEPN|nr:hypothetical protein EAO28_30185 [Klebsiella pneumoniae]
MLIVLDSSIGSARYFSAGFCSYIPPFLPVMALFPAVSLLKLKGLKHTHTGHLRLRPAALSSRRATLAGAAASHPPGSAEPASGFGPDG